MTAATPTSSGHVIVGLDDRPRHVDVDEVAVDLALRGWRHHAVRLSRAECVAAVREGRRRHIGGPTLALLLCLHEREVQRLQAEVRQAAARRGRP